MPVDSLGLLLGRDFLDGLKAVIHFADRALLCKLFGGHPMQLERLAAGHLALRLIPEAWPDAVKGRRRPLGPDGVVELSLGCQAWT